MAIATNVKFNYADLRLFPNNGKRHELVDGEHIVTPAPKTAHQNASGNLFTRFHTFVRKHRLGKVFAAPLDIVFTEFDVTEPDIIFVSRARQDYHGGQCARRA